MTPSICHPERPNFGHGYCAPCYQRRRNQFSPGKPAECHPERRMYARKLCSACYQAKRRAGRLEALAPLAERKRLAADLSTLKRLKDIGEKTISEPRWRSIARAQLLRADRFPTYLTPLSEPPPTENTAEREQWLRALWAWLLTWQPPQWDD